MNRRRLFGALLGLGLVQFVPALGMAGDVNYVLNPNPVEIGQQGSRYVVMAWARKGHTDPWVEVRSLTGN